MDKDNNLLLEKYFSSHNSPYEKQTGTSKFIKFADSNNFETRLLELYNETHTNSVYDVYNLVYENFKDVTMQLSRTSGYKHIYTSILGDYDIEGCQTHFLRPRPKVQLYEDNSDNLSKWVSLAIFKRGTSTALFRI